LQRRERTETPTTCNLRVKFLPSPARCVTSVWVRLFFGILSVEVLVFRGRRPSPTRAPGEGGASSALDLSRRKYTRHDTRHVAGPYFCSHVSTAQWFIGVAGPIAVDVITSFGCVEEPRVHHSPHLLRPPVPSLFLPSVFSTLVGPFPRTLVPWIVKIKQWVAAASSVGI
jgi:hypothetical protein